MKVNNSGDGQLFIGRSDELSHLEHLYERSRNELVVCALTGHRRIGKTTLINHFGNDKKSLYFFVSPKTELELIKSFRLTLKRQLDIPDYVEFGSLSAIIEYVFDNFEGMVVFDEFQNFSRVDPSIFSDIQNLVDSGKSSKILLILSGSYLGMMKEIFHHEKEPLFGRLDSEIRLGPFGIGDVFDYLSSIGFQDFEKMITIYAVFGGTPFYYALMRKLGVKGEIKDIIGEMFFNPYSLLKDEVRNILTLEFGNARDMYYSILEAISLGHYRASEIAQYMGYRTTSLSPYIKDLLHYYEYIARSVPVTARAGRRTKITRYSIIDPMMSFWFRFIYRNIGEMESGMYNYLLAKTMEEFGTYMGRRMEDIIKELLYRHQGEVLPFSMNRIGSWWTRRGDEIDLVALDDEGNNILLSEVKWRNKKADYNVVDKLLRKAEMVKGYDDYKRWFLVVSKMGFTPSALSRMGDNGILHWDSDHLMEMV